MWVLMLLSGLLSQTATYVLPLDDPERIQESTNVILTPQPPSQTIPLISRDLERPNLWHAPVATFYAPNGVLIWYQRVDSAESQYADQRTLCLGVWTEGRWVTPPLHEIAPAWGGPNNIVMRRSPRKPTWGGFNVFQIVRVNDRFEMLYWDQPAEGNAGALRSTSTDGMEWTLPGPRAVFTEYNDAFTLLPLDGEYYLYQTMLEDWPDKPYPDNLPGKRRVIALRKSGDLETWTEQQALLRPDDQDPPETEFYLFKAVPFRGRFLGLLMKYFGDPENPNRHSTRIAVEMLTSSDAVVWERPFRTTDLKFWTYADPFEDNGKLHFPAGEGGGMVLRVFDADRLFGVSPIDTEKEGVFTTRAFGMPARDLAVNLDARGGWADVELLDGAGAPLGGIGPCRIADIDSRSFRLTWEGLGSSAFQLQQSRLRFRLYKSRVFAIIEAQ